MALVDQYDQVRAVVMAFGHLGRAGELVDDGEDDPLAAFADAFGEIAARRRFRSRAILLRTSIRAERTAGHEIGRELLLEIAPVGDHHNPAVLERIVEQQCLA